MTILVWYVSVSPAVMLSRVPIVLIFYVIGYKINSSPETVVEVVSTLHRNVPYF